MARQVSVEVQDRRREACELRLAGAGYVVIAQRLGYAGPSGAFAAVKAAIASGIEESAAEVLHLELDRLDAMLLALWPKARCGDLKAVDRVLKVMERRACYLGLDATDSHQADEGGEQQGDEVPSAVAVLRARRRARRTVTSDSTQVDARPGALDPAPAQYSVPVI